MWDFIHELDFSDLPPEVTEKARWCLLDLLGVAAAGSATRLSRIIRTHARRNFRGDGSQATEARLLFDGRTASPVGAAMAGAATIDAMDGHDGHRLAKGHAGVAVLPAALALLDGAAGATTRDLLTAVVAGYEVGTRAGVVLHATAGDYHSSGAWNALAAATVGARVLRLDAATTDAALGIAEFSGPRAPMMRCIAAPTMVKDSSAWGAQAGVSAALLAADGFTGAPAELLRPSPDGGNAWEDLGHRWAILEHYLKPYPVCRWAHPAVQAAIDLVASYDVPPERIRRVEVTTFHAATQLATRNPGTTEQAQYSLPFSVAAATVHRGLPPSVVAHPEGADVQTRRLAAGIVLHESAEMTADFPADRVADVTLVVDDGHRLTSGRTTAVGDPEVPLGYADVVRKFETFARPVVGDQRTRRLVRCVDDIGGCDLRVLLDEVCAPPEDGHAGAVPSTELERG